MEITIGLLVLVAIGVAWYFNTKKSEPVSKPAPQVPYKLETPQPAPEPVQDEKPQEVVQTSEKPKKAPAKKAAKPKTTAKKAPTPKKPKIKVVK